MYNKDLCRYFPAECLSKGTGGQAFTIFPREVTPYGTYHSVEWAVKCCDLGIK